jgi:hypothetical protein
MEVDFSQLGMPHFCLPHITMANESIRKETQHTLLVHARISKGKKKKRKTFQAAATVQASRLPVKRNIRAGALCCVQHIHTFSLFG